MSITDELNERLKKDLEELKRMRDQFKVKMHLAGMDAREHWKTLEPKIEELEQKLVKSGAELGAATSRMFEEVGKAFRDFGDRLSGRKSDDSGGASDTERPGTSPPDDPDESDDEERDD